MPGEKKASWMSLQGSEPWLTRNKRKKSYPQRATKALSLTATGYQGHDRIVDFRLFHSRMIRPVVGGGGPTCLKQTPAPGGWKPVHSQARVDFLFTSMHRMHRIFPGDGWLVVLDIRVASGQAFAFESRFAEMGEPSHRHASRVTGVSPKGAVRLSEKSPARHPPTAPSGRPTRERGRPARMLSRCVPLSFPAMRHRATCRRERHGLGRSRVLAPLPVEPGGGDGRGCAKTCAGGTPALPGGLHPMTSSHQRRFIGLRVHLCSFVVRLY